MKRLLHQGFLIFGTLFIFGLASSPGNAQLPPAVELALTQARIQPLNPSIPAPNFKLPTLAGGEMTLADAKGRWVLLTFFATWCGPCKSEMPSLQRFSEMHAADGFDVLGVSTDSSMGVVKPFARKFRLTFPIAVDTQSQVASLYQASSIPVSFLIAPNGHLVGIARGARDWSKVGATVAKLVKAMPPGADVSSAYAANATPIELPTVLNPPTATYALSRDSFVPNQRFSLDIAISWAGHFEDYLLHPPSVSLPEGLKQHAMRADTGTALGRKTVTYRFVLEPESEGRFALDPIELRYTPRLEQEPISSRIAGPTIVVAAPLIYGLSRTTFGGLVLGVLLLGIVAYFLFRPRQKTESPIVTAELTSEAGEALFQEAKHHRHQGDIAGFLKLLAKIHEDLPAGHQPLPDYPTLISNILYGGLTIPPTELDQLQRTVELKLNQLRTDSDVSDRDLLAETKRKGVTS